MPALSRRLFLGAGVTACGCVAVAWVGFAPWLVRAHIVPDTSFAACSAWLVWPGLGLLLAGSFLPLILDWRSVVRAASDLGSLVRRRGGATTDPGTPSRGAGGSSLAVPALLSFGHVVLSVNMGSGCPRVQRWSARDARRERTRSLGRTGAAEWDVHGRLPRGSLRTRRVQGRRGDANRGSQP